MTINEKFLVLAGGAIVSGAVAGSVYMYSKMSGLARKLDMTVSDIAGKTPVNISEAIVDKAVQQAVDREVGLTVSRAASMAVREISDEMRSQVRKSVSNSYNNVEEKVSTEISRQVSNLDYDHLRRDVTEKAKAQILSKFDDNLDGLLGEFKRNLENTTKIYGHIASSLIKQPTTNEVTFKIS